MADKLIRVNSRVSVMASQVTAVVTPDYRDTVEVHTLDGQVHELEFTLVRERYDAKIKFEKAVNDALNGL